MESLFQKELLAHRKTFEAVAALEADLMAAAECCIDSLQSGGKILFFGNGGSAADAQHLAAELTGRYKQERRGLAAIALTTDTSALTAIGNDYGYARIFERQVEALAHEKDVLIGLSTSGNSENVLRALRLGRELKCHTIGFSGRGGGQMAPLCGVNLIAPSDDTPRIQECHIFLGHLLCDWIERAFSQ